MKRLTSILLLALFALSIIAMAVPVSARIDNMEFTIRDETNERPNTVVPGGAFEIDVRKISILLPVVIDGRDVYFWLSTDTKPKVSSGDIRLLTWEAEDKMAADDFIDIYVDGYAKFPARYLTLWVPTDVEADEYWVKISDSDDVGDPAVLSESLWEGTDMVEVVTESLPTITVDPTSGPVSWQDITFAWHDTVDVEGEDIISDYWDEDAVVYWDSYESPNAWQGLRGSDLVEDPGEFALEDAVIPEAYMGDHKFIVTLYDGSEYLGAYVDFVVEPSVDVVPGGREFVNPLNPFTYVYSIPADEPDQLVDLYVHGFPDGATVDKHSTRLIVRDIETDAVVEDGEFKLFHDEVDIEEYAGTGPGTFVGGWLTWEDAPVADHPTLQYAPEGVIDIVFEAGDETITLEKQLLSSAPGERGDFLARMSPDSGVVGDEVSFWVIDLPASASIEVIFRGEFYGVAIERTFYALSDGNGGWMTHIGVGPLLVPCLATPFIELPDMPGGAYDVWIHDLSTDVQKRPTPRTFTVEPDVTFWEHRASPADTTSCVVGDGVDFSDDDIRVTGTGFPLLAEFDTIVIAGEEVDSDVYWTIEPPWDPIPNDGTFDSGWFDVPHASGGGKDVGVSIEGEDFEGEAISVEAEITLKPRIEILDAPDTGLMVLEPSGDWENYDAVMIFGGNPTKLTGAGWLANEGVTITFSSDALDEEEEATITDGGVADSDGDLEVVFEVPVGRYFAQTVDDWNLLIEGKTDTNEVELADGSPRGYGDKMTVSVPIDAEAKLFFGLEPDGDLDIDWCVYDEVRVVGCGFKSGSPSGDIDLEIDGTDVGTGEARWGYFDTTVEIPEKPGREKADPEDFIEYYVEEVTTGEDRRGADFYILSKIVLDPTVGPMGTTVTVKGTGFAEDEDVDIEWEDLPDVVSDIGPDEDGLFEETFKVPTVVPGVWMVTGNAEGLPDREDIQEEEGPEVAFTVIGPMKIVSLSVPTTVHRESTVTISVTVQDYYGAAVVGAKVTGSITPPVGAKVSLTFPDTDAAGTSAASWTLPADAAEGSYKVDVKAEKAAAGGVATSSGSFYVEVEVPVPPYPEVPPGVPPLIDKVRAEIAAVSSDVKDVAGRVSGLATDVAGLKSAIAALEATVKAIPPPTPIELIYVIAIISIVAAIAAIAAVIAIYRKIA